MGSFLEESIEEIEPPWRRSTGPGARAASESVYQMIFIDTCICRDVVAVLSPPSSTPAFGMHPLAGSALSPAGGVHAPVGPATATVPGTSAVGSIINIWETGGLKLARLKML